MDAILRPPTVCGLLDYGPCCVDWRATASYSEVTDRAENCPVFFE
jgi:hypothetical protein